MAQTGNRYICIPRDTDPERPPVRAVACHLHSAGVEGKVRPGFSSEKVSAL